MRPEPADRGSVEALWPSGRAGRRLRSVVAALIVLVGLALIGVRELPTSWWAVPLSPGPLADGVLLVELRRGPGHLHLTFEADGQRSSLRLTHRGTTAAPPALATAGRYRLDVPEGAVPAPPAAVDAVAARVAAWESQVPRPPAFVQAPGHVPSTLQRLERSLLDLWLLVGLAVWLPGLPGLLRRTGLTLGTGAALLVLSFGPVAGAWWMGWGGVWHANQHGYDRMSDLLHGLPAWSANLGLLHGHGYYTVMSPLVGGGPDPGRDVTLVAALVGGVAVALWGTALRLLTGSWSRALAASLVWGASALWLRVGPSEAMYVPAAAALGAVAVATELLVLRAGVSALVLLLPPLVLAMQTRADLLALAPAWVLTRLLVAAPGVVLELARRPGAWALAVGAALTLLPRLHSLLNVDHPGDSGRPLLDPSRDPRSVLLGIVALLGIVLIPWVRERLPGRGPTARWLGAVVGAIAACGWAIWRRSQPDGYAPSPQLHVMLDPALTAPWLVVAALVGVLVIRRDPGLAATVLLSVAGPLLVYLGRYDCLSTYAATGVATAPWLGLLVAEGIDGVMPRVPPSLRAAALVALVGGGVVWSASWLALHFPKQQEWTLVQETARLPAGSTVVWLAASDAPDDTKRRGYHTQRLDLARHVGDRLQVASIDAWARGEVSGEAWLLITTDCFRPLLRAGSPRTALVGEVEVPWRYLKTPIASTGRRIAVDDLPSDRPWIDPRCALARSRAGAPRASVSLTHATSGSIYEEVVVDDAVIGLYPIGPPPR